MKNETKSDREHRPDDAEAEREIIDGEGVVYEQNKERDIGLPEIATEEELERENGEVRDRMRVTSDMRDAGDPDGPDVGIPGGLGAGGDASLGGSGGLEKDSPPKEEDFENPEEMGGTGEPNPEENR